MEDTSGAARRTTDDGQRPRRFGPRLEPQAKCGASIDGGRRLTRASLVTPSQAAHLASTPQSAEQCTTIRTQSVQTCRSLGRRSRANLAEPSQSAPCPGTLHLHGRGRAGLSDWFAQDGQAYSGRCAVRCGGSDRSLSSREAAWPSSWRGRVGHGRRLPPCARGQLRRATCLAAPLRLSVPQGEKW